MRSLLMPVSWRSLPLRRFQTFAREKSCCRPLISPMFSSNGLHIFFTVLCYHGGRIVECRNPGGGVSEASPGLIILER